MKGTISPEVKKKAIHRLRIMSGVVKGLEDMIEQEKYCVDILTQSAAVQESLKALDSYILENHIKTHIAAMMKGGNTSKAVAELMKLYKFKNRG